jgi:hypothetical protein
VTARKGRRLDGFRLAGAEYRPIVPEGRGWLWSEQLGLFVGLWQGRVGDEEAGWIRLYRPDGTLVPTPQERAEAAEQRAETAETELARLRALIQQQGRD